MKPHSFGLLSLVLLILTASVIVRPQQSSFTVASIRPFDKAVAGQVMELMIEGIWDDLSLYAIDSLIVKLPKDLKGGDVKFTIENSDGDRYSTPVTKTFVLASR